MRSIAGAALLAVLLASFATAYAMWSETLSANITVYTGEVDVEFASWSCSDTGPDPQAEGFTNSEGKDVASCSVEVEATDDEGDTITLGITLDNAYPGYQVVITAEIENIGTVPVKLYQWDIDNDYEDYVTVELSIPDDTQIDPGGTAEYQITITVNQAADENADYGTMTVTLVFAQWNEVT